MDYLNHLISKWMQPPTSRVAVDSHPRLSGIMDTINSTLAHGPFTRLPSEFYDEKGRRIIEHIGVEEWFSGYKESTEYRKLGIGALMGDIVSRMAGSVERDGNDGMLEVGGEDGKTGTGRGGEKEIKLAMSGCHDTTLGGVLASLGTFDNEPWPPFTSHIAIELFRKSDLPIAQTDMTAPNRIKEETTPDTAVKPSWWSSLFGTGSAKSPPKTQKPVPATPIARRPTSDLTDIELRKLQGYYVRLRYNDRVMTVPGCKPAGKHLEGDESFCTLVRSSPTGFSRLTEMGAKSELVGLIIIIRCA